MTLEFKVRPADPSDAEALTRLAEEVSAEPEGWLISANGEWRSVGDERRYLKALRRYPNAALFVAEQGDGTIVGRISLARDTHPASGHVADLGLMVARDARGHGVGRALLAAAVEWGRDSGIRKLELHVFPWNEPAIRLYERFGFEREGYRKGHYRRSGDHVDVDAILMAYGVHQRELSQRGGSCELRLNGKEEADGFLGSTPQDCLHRFRSGRDEPT